MTRKNLMSLKNCILCLSVTNQFFLGAILCLKKRVQGLSGKQVLSKPLQQLDLHS